MNLVEATLVLVVIVLVAISILYLALSKGVLNRVTESQAVQLVTSDLENKYPGGIVNVTNVTPSARYPGSWHIVVSLVLNATSPCPNYVVYSYYTNLWQITYSSPKANYSVEVWITQLNGTLVSVNTTG